MATGYDQSPAPDLVTGPDALGPEEHSAPIETAPIVPRSLLRTWDDAIMVYVAEDNEPGWLPAAVTQSSANVAEPTASALESTLTAGVAVALWGSWEFRSARGDRRRRS